MKTFHMVEEQSKALDLDRITSKLMLNPGSKNNSGRGKIEGSIKVIKGLNPCKSDASFPDKKQEDFESA